MAFLAPLAPLLIPIAKKGAKMAYSHYKDNKSKDSSKDVQEELLEKGLSVSAALIKKGAKAAYSKSKGKGKGKKNKKKTDEDKEEEEDDNLMNIDQGGMNAGPRGNQGYYDQDQFGNQGPQGQPDFQTFGRGMSHNHVDNSQGSQGDWNGPGMNVQPNQGHPNYGNPGFGGPSNVNQGYGGPSSAFPTYESNGSWQGNGQYGNPPSGYPGNRMPGNNMYPSPLSPRYHDEHSANGYTGSANNIPTGLNQHPPANGNLGAHQYGGHGRNEVSREAQTYQIGDQSKGIIDRDQALPMIKEDFQVEHISRAFLEG